MKIAVLGGPRAGDLVEVPEGTQRWKTPALMDLLDGPAEEVVEIIAHEVRRYVLRGPNLEIRIAGLVPEGYRQEWAPDWSVALQCISQLTSGLSA